MIVLGIAAHYHDASSCIMKDGALLAAAQEERFTRVKNDPSFPVTAIRFCLDHLQASIQDVDVVAYYERPWLKAERQAWMLRNGASGARPDAARPERQIREVLGYEGRVDYWDHHLSHAASAFFFSGRPEAAVVTLDGVGEWTTGLIAHGHGGELEVKRSTRFPHSLGLFYSAVTSYLGFEVNEGEYKVMGLAAFGEPRYVRELERVIQWAASEGPILDATYFRFGGERMFSEEWAALLGRAPTTPGSAPSQFDADLACSAQRVLENVVLLEAQEAKKLAPCDTLCMAGGVALNCVANSRVRDSGLFSELWVQPAAGDAGGSIGAAALSSVARGVGIGGRLESAHLGPDICDAAVDDLVREAGCAGQRYDRDDEMLEVVAARLEAGAIVGWCQGRMEFGPRALGARSILADPRRPEVKERVNAAVKGREVFRPFAPAVLQEHAAMYFEPAVSSPFMLETARVRTDALPAVTHVDGSARVQAVPKEGMRFRRLLEVFYARTGCAALLNTSFNVKGEPIVCSARDALACFVRARLDVLCLGKWVLERRDVPAEWYDWFRAGDIGRATVVSQSYTFF